MRNTIDLIKINVCNFYGIRISDLEARNRKKHIVQARHIYCYLADELTTETLESIGQSIKRDHASVLFARDKMNFHYKTYESTKKAIIKIKELINNDCEIVINHVDLLEMCKNYSKSFL